MVPAPGGLAQGYRIRSETWEYPDNPERERVLIETKEVWPGPGGGISVLPEPGSQEAAA